MLVLSSRGSEDLPRLIDSPHFSANYTAELCHFGAPKQSDTQPFYRTNKPSNCKTPDLPNYQTTGLPGLIHLRHDRFSMAFGVGQIRGS
ncbi:hypothetical protein IWX65_002872 [Arthrobacter sp. CAN_A214]